MSMIVLLIWICLSFCIAELMADNYPKLQKSLFHLLFLIITVLSTAKFMYGADVSHYYPEYQSITTSSWATNAENMKFDIGYTYFCFLCKKCGIDYWGMTAIVSVLYFGAVYWLFSFIKENRKTLAFTVLVVMDHTLFLEQTRQCMALTFIILAYCCYRQYRHIIFPLVCCFVACLLHRTALPFLGFVMVCWLCSGLRIEWRSYLLLLVALIMFLIIPLHNLLVSFESYLPENLQHTFVYHLVLGKQIQKIFFLYMAVILALAYYTSDKVADKKTHWIMWCSMAVIVFLYQYYLLLNRIRSYMLPFLVLYIFNTFAVTDIKDKLPKQLLAGCFLLYSVIFTIDLPKRYALMISPTDKISFVWELRNTPKQVLIERQMKQAKLYWKTDNKKGIQMGLQ